MKFKSSIDINKSIEKVTVLFADPTNNGEYQEGFTGKELISGNEGEDGAVSMMYYKSGRQKIDLEETITANRLPDSFEASYHHKHMDNTMKCTFTVLDENKTRYEAEYEYTRIEWIMPKLFAILFPSMYKKPGERWMRNFKAFVERQ